MPIFHVIRVTTTTEDFEVEDKFGVDGAVYMSAYPDLYKDGKRDYCKTTNVSLDITDITLSTIPDDEEVSAAE